MRIRQAAQPARQTAETEQDALELRAELDELLRARQYAGQRERRLAEAVRTAPDQQLPDGEVLRQLAQARTLREGLGERCIELSEQLKDLEIRLRQPAPRRAIPQQPTGARFGGAYSEAHAPSTPPAPPASPAPPAPQPTAPAPATGARFGPARPPAAEPDGPAPTGAPKARSSKARTPQAPPPPPPAPEPPRRRSPAELLALAERITTLHRQGATREPTALIEQAAVLLAPPDTARLAALLARSGPVGTSVQLARAVAQGSPDQAAATLAELRQAGSAEEAAELFHTLWSYPAAALPGLLAALERTGQHADGATLLWEWGSAPTAEIADLAAALQRAGRTADARTLLRQAAGRPTADLTALATTLAPPLPAVLLHELAALRPPAELVRLAAALDGRPELYDELLTALTADEGRHRTTLAALRTAGLPTTPTAPARSRWGRRQDRA
ncbi:hypothetical protein ACGFZP_00695 [Kitasatospora sp. NPDC048239]|uniref:hypothetical protein n=1 Tax=Kitasatospora sp. NPDC048239 TaxID=3364046 RepID=UPI003719B512